MRWIALFDCIRRLNNRGMIQELIIFIITLTKYWYVGTFLKRSLSEVTIKAVHHKWYKMFLSEFFYIVEQGNLYW